MIDGILPIDKPQGWTSHDVVARVRRLAGQRQVGHAGTLDPLATGLLLVVLGHATRFSDMLMHTTKTYRAEIVLGVTTMTDDAEAPILEERDPSGVTRSSIETALQRFIGEIEQQPPAYAAIKQDGRKLYQLAREGEEIRHTTRRVQVDDIVVERWQAPRVRLRIQCGSGTYIRSIARDLGAELGVGGYLHALRRIHSGSFDVSDARSLTQLEEGGVRAAVLSADWAVASWPAIVANDDLAGRVSHGLSFPQANLSAAHVRVYRDDGTLLALARPRNGGLHPFLVIKAGGDAGRS